MKRSGLLPDLDKETQTQRAASFPNLFSHAGGGGEWLQGRRAGRWHIRRKIKANAGVCRETWSSGDCVSHGLWEILLPHVTSERALKDFDNKCPEAERNIFLTPLLLHRSLSVSSITSLYVVVCNEDPSF